MPRGRKLTKKQLQLQRQLKRIAEANWRRLAANQSRRPRPRQGRIGSAAARRDARALSRLRSSRQWRG
jgi:hypothetical protein